MSGCFAAMKPPGWRDVAMARRSDMGGFGGGSFEHPRGYSWDPRGVACPGSAELPRATRRTPRRCAGAELGRCQGGTLLAMLNDP